MNVFKSQGALFFVKERRSRLFPWLIDKCQGQRAMSLNLIALSHFYFGPIGNFLLVIFALFTRFSWLLFSLLISPLNKNEYEYKCECACDRV